VPSTSNTAGTRSGIILPLNNVHREVVRATADSGHACEDADQWLRSHRDRSVAVGEAGHYMRRSTCEWYSPQIASSAVACWSSAVSVDSARPCSASDQSRSGSQSGPGAERTWGVPETLISSAAASGRGASRGQRAQEALEGDNGPA
jgi:hypothetical protein